MMQTNISLLPPIKWVGGKRRELPVLQTYYPSIFDRLIIPFIGGGAVYFSLNHHRNVINDINIFLINTYDMVAKGYGKKLYNELTKMSYTESAYYSYRKSFNELKTGKEYKDYTTTDKFNFALLFLYLNKVSYRGQMRFNSKGYFNIPYGHYRTKPNYEWLLNNDYYNLLNKTEIYNDDYKEFMNKLSYTSKDFVFLDPPYDCIMNDYGYGAFDKQNFITLKNYMKNTQAQVLLVVNKTKFTTEVFQEFIKTEYDYKYSYRSGQGKVQDSDVQAIHLVCSNYNNFRGII